MSVGSERMAQACTPISGFEHVASIWSPEFNQCAFKIAPGEYYVTARDEYITTVLGSCISACVRDPETGLGGMNHFMLPGDQSTDVNKWGGQDKLATRYGIAAMETLINDILKQGGNKNRLELKLFGGGTVLAMEVNNVGERNIEFARQFVATEGLKIAAEDLGGPYPRKVNYFPKTGRVMVKRLRSLQKCAIVERERDYERSLGQQDTSGGDIDLFD